MQKIPLYLQDNIYFQIIHSIICKTCKLLTIFIKTIALQTHYYLTLKNRKIKCLKIVKDDTLFFLNKILYLFYNLMRIYSIT